MLMLLLFKFAFLIFSTFWVYCLFPNWLFISFPIKISSFLIILFTFSKVNK